MADIKVIAKLKPMGKNFRIVDAEDVELNGKGVDEVINGKEDDIKHFKTWAEYEAAKNTIPSGAMFVVDEDNPENKIPKHNILEGRDEANAHPYTAITGLQAELDKKTDATKTQTLESRMNQFAKLPEGSTAGDAELADIRVGADGKTYENAGEAVRGQVTSLKETIAEFKDAVTKERYTDHLLADADYMTKHTGKLDTGAGLSDLASYDTYQFTATSDINIYFSQNDEYYISLTVYSDSSMTSVIVPRVRHQARETTWGNFPLSNNPIAIAKGSFVSVCINNWNNKSRIYNDDISGGFTLADGVALSATQKTEINSIVSTAIDPVAVDATTAKNISTALKDDIYALCVNMSAVSDVVKLEGYSASVTDNGIMCTQLAPYDTYYFIATKNANVYFVDVLSYTAIARGNNYSGIEHHTTNEILLSDNPVRYRASEGNLPTKSSPLAVTVGDVVAVTVPTGADIELYGYESDMSKISDDFIFNVNQSKKCKVRYVADSTIPNSQERLEVFIPTIRGYVRYDYVHSVNTEINADNWRVNNAYAVNDKLASRYSLTAGGEWEVAVHLADRDDFSGGILHGDHVTTKITILIDGTPVSAASLSQINEFEELRIVTESTLYDPVDSTTIIAKDNGEHRWNMDGLTIAQRLVWQRDESITNCYLAMFPAKQSVFSSYYTDADYVTETIPNNKSVFDAHTAILYSDATAGVNAEFAVIEYPELERLYVTDNGADLYHKCYYVVKHDGSVAAGTKWKSEIKYNFVVSK